MQKKCKGPHQISLSNLAALKERLGNKSGAPLTSQPNNTDRGEAAVQGISTLHQDQRQGCHRQLSHRYLRPRRTNHSYLKVVSQLHKVDSLLLLVPGCLNNTPKLTLLNTP